MRVPSSFPWPGPDGPPDRALVGAAPILIKDLPVSECSISPDPHSWSMRSIARQPGAGATRLVARPWRHSDAKGGSS